jgi:hypothetical protein
MKLTVLTKWSAAFGITAIIASGLAAPASADPVFTSPNSANDYGVLAGVGSDTTQDVTNGLSAAIGRTGDGTTNLKLSSYDATGSYAIVTKSGADPIYRANGSGAGLAAIRSAIGNIGNTALTTFTGHTGTWKTAQMVDQIQYARSSSAGASASANASGVVTYVPFATDVVGYAVSANSVMPDLTVGTSSDVADGTGVTPSSLWAIYTCAARKIVVVAGEGTKLVSNTYSAGVGETLVDIHPYVPQSSSGTASFWQGGSASSKFGANLGSCASRTGVVGEIAEGDSVQEHDGSVLEGDEGAIVPFSVPQWVAQGNSAAILAASGVAVTDRRNGAVLGTLNGLNPTTGSTGSYALNPAMISNAGASPNTGDNKPSYLSRTMYNIVPSAKLDVLTSAEYLMFGPGGLICSDTSTITQFGFGALSSGCGDTSARFFAPAASSVTAVPATNVTTGSELTFAVNVTFSSNGNQGGTVTVEDADANVVAGVTGTTIAAGSTTTTINIPVANKNKTLTVYVTPNLSGIAEASSPVAKFTPVVTATSSGASSKSKTGKATVTIGNQGSKATGTVEIYNGATRVGIGQLGATGSVTITVAKMSKGTKTLTVKYLGDANYAPKLDATLSYRVK